MPGRTWPGVMPSTPARACHGLDVPRRCDRVRSTVRASARRRGALECTKTTNLEQTAGRSSRIARRTALMSRCYGGGPRDQTSDMRRRSPSAMAGAARTSRYPSSPIARSMCSCAHMRTRTPAHCTTSTRASWPTRVLPVFRAPVPDGRFPHVSGGPAVRGDADLPALDGPDARELVEIRARCRLSSAACDLARAAEYASPRSVEPPCPPVA